ncbi:hypothetical protein Vau01_098180 [Virgisporangium aurantiacum]|uniref:Uncharacterized protein n=1 Tax=Virgisporangium aurantiacum TaxID=175570 RepID=A0A8J3ZG69_9ACTN|nr:hypothetical protein Vau01_098180 [Virgisporangium aurantiacum]
MSSRADYGITLVTPMLADNSPQARAGEGYGCSAFTESTIAHVKVTETRHALDQQSVVEFEAVLRRERDEPPQPIGVGRRAGER